jgi:cyanophycinase-like exopeptidase
MSAQPRCAVVAVLALAVAMLPAAPAHAAVTRIRLGSATDVARTSWSGPAFTMNGSGAVVPVTMTKAIDAIRAGSGSLDVTVLAASAPTSGSKTPECDTMMALAGVNSCTTLTLTSRADGNNAQVNTDISNAEFIYFAGGDQCKYAAWKGTTLQASVQSVVAKGGGAGGGSAGTHINSDVVYDACSGSVLSSEALANPYNSYISFTTGMFSWPFYGATVNDSHFVTRDRMGRTMAFVARMIKDGLAGGGKAWGVGVEEGGSLYIDRNGLATLSGPDAYVVLGDHQPEKAVAGQPLTFSNYKIWRLTAGQNFDFAHRPTCGYYLRSVSNGVADPSLYAGTPITDCGGTGGGGSSFAESEPNDSRSQADSLAGLTFPSTVSGSMASSADRDYFATTLASGQTLSATCDIPAAYDADLYLLNASGSTLARSVNDGAGADESLTYTRTAAGSATYYIELEAYAGSGSASYSCLLAH